jgi:signal transduction histidine kinase
MPGSIRNKLIFSYLFLVLTSMVLLGFFFGARMKQVMEESRLRESFSHAAVLAGTIDALAGDSGLVAPQAEMIAARFSGEEADRLRVYSPGGFLLADSRERSTGFLSPGDGNLILLFPPGPYREESGIVWHDEGPGGLTYVHSTWGVLRSDGGDLLQPFSGAVDISIPLSRNDPDFARRAANFARRFEKIGAQLATALEMEISGGASLQEAAAAIIAREPLRDVYRIRVYSTSRNIVGGSETLEAKGAAAPGQKGGRHWYEDPGTGRILSVSVPVGDGAGGGAAKGVLVLSSSVKLIDTASADLQRLLLYAILLSLAVTVIISVLLARVFVEPVARIQEAAGKIAGGDYTARVDYRNSDEIGSLVGAINEMAARLQADLALIIGEREKMGALLSALPDGVIALDREGGLLFLNSSASRLTGIPLVEATGKPLFTLWSVPEIQEFFRTGRESRELVSREVSVPPRTLRIYLLPFGAPGTPGGTMMVLQDVTDVRRLEETRTQFLGSVSHELRTPLTVIKGFVQAVIENDSVRSDPQVEKALGVIDRETDRLTRLVKELLELSRLRSRKAVLDMESLPIDDVVGETAAMMMPNGERMGVEIIFSGGGRDARVYGDCDRLKQVVINLLDNAIKYSPHGGRVSLSTRLQDDRWVMEIIDQGMGIPQDEIPHLFQHFFRARERRDGKSPKGTGLGMAIVKEIVDAHRGQVLVESQEGEGTKILVSLPIARP